MSLLFNKACFRYHFVCFLLLLTVIFGSGFVQAQRRTQRELAGVFGNVKKIVQGRVPTGKGTIVIGGFTWEYDCAGNLLHESSIGAGNDYEYRYIPIDHDQAKLKYSIEDSMGHSPPKLFARSVWVDRSRSELFFLARYTVDIQRKNGEYDGLIVYEKAFPGEEPADFSGSPRELAWLNTYIYDKLYRLKEFRGVRGDTLLTTRRTYIYDKDSPHPATVEEEFDYKLVTKKEFSYLLDANRNWTRRDETATYLQYPQPMRQSSIAAREVTYFKPNECKADGTHSK